jgi:hypothetical protein
MPIAQTRAGTQQMVALAIEPSGEGPYVEAMRDWIERLSVRPRAASLRLVR